MAILAVYAGNSATMTVLNNKLPSPSRMQVSIEQIWSQETGRSQDKAQKAKMLGESLVTKHTYALEWGMLEDSDFDKITQLLPRDFFYFGVGTETSVPSNPVEYYRSEIQYEVIQVGSTQYYKNINVQVIER